MATTEKNAAVAAGISPQPPEPGPDRTSVRRSASIGKLAAALAKAQAQMKNPVKDSVNPHFKSRYADLATVRDAVIPVLAAHGLAVMQFPCEHDGYPSLLTLLAHDSGEWAEAVINLRAKATDPQGVGSALTFMRRYSLQAMAGVAADDDDDGGHASRPAAGQRPAAGRSTPGPAAAAPLSGAALVARVRQDIRAATSAEVLDRIATDMGNAADRFPDDDYDRLSLEWQERMQAVGGAV